MIITKKAKRILFIVKDLGRTEIWNGIQSNSKQKISSLHISHEMIKFQRIKEKKIIIKKKSNVQI